MWINSKGISRIIHCRDIWKRKWSLKPSSTKQPVDVNSTSLLVKFALGINCYFNPKRILRNKNFEQVHNNPVKQKNFKLGSLFIPQDTWFNNLHVSGQAQCKTLKYWQTLSTLEARRRIFLLAVTQSWGYLLRIFSWWFKMWRSMKVDRVVLIATLAILTCIYTSTARKGNFPWQFFS